MNIVELPDSEVFKIAEPIWNVISESCSTKDWSKYSHYFSDDDRENLQHKYDILNQWDNNPVFVSLTEEKQLITILRRENAVVVVWKLGSTAVNGELIVSIRLTAVGSEIKVTGVSLN